MDEDIPLQPDAKDKELEALRNTVAELRAQVQGGGQQPKTP